MKIPVPRYRPCAPGWKEAMNRIAVLLGEQPGKVHAELEQTRAHTGHTLEGCVGVPADVLRRRPDVRKAERELAAQTARIGVATADLYPKFTLSGSIGLEALSLSNLVLRQSDIQWRCLSITWRNFQGWSHPPKYRGPVRTQEQALIQYEATVLGALEEVENALVAYAEEQSGGNP